MQNKKRVIVVSKCFLAVLITTLTACFSPQESDPSPWKPENNVVNNQGVAAISANVDSHTTTAARNEQKTRAGSPIPAGASWELKLYHQLSQTQPTSNLFFSPYSISSALAIIYAGANGNTKEEMASVLPQEALGLADMEKKQQQLLTPIDAGISPLQLANALWMQKDKSLVIGFQNLIEDMFEGKIKIRGVDFKGNTEGARVTINNWAAKQTSGKISELLKPEILKKETQLVVTNAIYFRGDWALGFDKKKTQKQPFSTGPDGKTQVNVPFMTQVNTFKYLQNEKMQVLELPYKGGFDMVILLPNAQDGLTAIESSWLDPLQQAQLKPKMVQVFLPKFKIEAGAELKETLMVLGMPTVFTNEADLSGLTGNQDLSLAEVVHKTMVSVDEIGTEAIAATAAIVSSRGMGKPEAEFKANRPFIFLIRHQATNTILFVGKLTNPTPN